MLCNDVLPDNFFKKSRKMYKKTSASRHVNPPAFNMTENVKEVLLEIC